MPTSLIGRMFELPRVLVRLCVRLKYGLVEKSGVNPIAMYSV